MTDKVEVAPLNIEISQPDYQEKIQAAIKRPKVSSALSEEMAVVGWHHMEWVVGYIYSVRILEANIVEIILHGMSDLEHGGPWRKYYFQFRKPDADFIAEARRAQSLGLGFEFGCYVKYPLEPEGPFRVQQITYYEVWGISLIRVAMGPMPLRVVGAKSMGDPVEVHVMNK